jgi:histone-lysine N-methyltransferase SETMAR
LRFRRDGTFLKGLVTCDEKWIFYDNVIRKRQWCRPGGGGTNTYSKEKSALQKINDLCLVGYGRDYHELLGPNKTINSEVYCQQLDRVNECLKEKHPHIINRKGVVFHQDNARPHVSKMTQQKTKELNWEILDHPP